MDVGYKFVEFGIPLLVGAWFFREVWALLGHTDAALPAREPVGRADFRIAAGIAAAFFLIGLFRLGTPNKLYFDEVHHVRTAMEYIDGLDPHEWTHPPLSKLFMAASMRVAGVDFNPREGVWNQDAHYPFRWAVAWRLPSLVFGSLSLLFLYALARSLWGNRIIATASAALLCFDGVFWTHARIGMTNSYTVCFILAGTLGTWKYTQTGKARWLWLTGLALGLALATRWSSLWAWGFNGLLLVWHLGTSQWQAWREEKRTVPSLLGWIGAVGGAMIIIPLLLYTASYIPYVLQGATDRHERLFSAGEFGPVPWGQAWSENIRANGHGWFKVLNQQADMWRYHAGIKEGHPYSSRWWTWPLMLRPVWYFYEGVKGNVMGVWSIGNAFLWWAYLPTFAASVYLCLREKQRALSVVTLFGLGMWLAWGIKPRPLVFMHYLLESVPFLCMALAYLGWRLWTRGGEGAKRFVEFWASLIVSWGVFYYPLLSALPISEAYFRMHLWLDRIWI